MTISEELFAAVLAMDAYNRGYHSGLGNETVGLGEAGAIGNARILARPNEMNLEAWQAASFHGVA